MVYRITNLYFDRELLHSDEINILTERVIIMLMLLYACFYVRERVSTEYPCEGGWRVIGSNQIQHNLPQSSKIPKMYCDRYIPGTWHCCERGY